MDHSHAEGVPHLIAMERVYPCLVTAFTTSQIQTAIDLAESQLEQLWDSGWTHGA